MGNHIYTQLKHDILGLKLRPGDQLQELELAAQYGASRTPAREALMRLVQQQLVAKSGRRYVVRMFSPDEIRHLYEMREALETMTVRLATERATDGELAELATQVESLVPSITQDDVVSFHELDRAFHMAIARLARNPLLAAEIGRLLELARLIFTQSSRHVVREDAMRDTLAEHRRIVEAMRRRIASIAEEEMHQKFRRVTCLYLAAE
jgi:GntR family transcriptional regulator, rspAB operon transcriptional repressor